MQRVVCYSNSYPANSLDARLTQKQADCDWFPLVRVLLPELMPWPVSKPAKRFSMFLCDVAVQTGGNWTLWLEFTVSSWKRKCVKGLPPEDTDFIKLLIGPR